MRYHRDDVVARALEVLDTYGLGDLTMRRLGTELGVQPSALYHHFATKQLLLAAVADWTVEELVDYEDDIVEGTGHRGRSALIGLVAKKPSGVTG